MNSHKLDKRLLVIYGPFTESIGGYRYVISFADRYSRLSVCYFLKHESDVEEA